MNDDALVAAMVAGDPRGLDGAYRRYAPRLLAYSRGMLQDPEAAADVVHDTFIIAGQRVAQLREPARLLAWLYAIARNECLRQLRGRSRQVPLAEVGEPKVDTVDLGATAHSQQVRELVHAAAAGLNEGDRDVIELAIRHGLSAADVAAVLGVSTNHAHARLSRARTQLERALGVLLVARAAKGECPTLTGLLQGWGGELTQLLRKRLSRHIDGCAICADRRRMVFSPAALLGAYAALPFVVGPELAARRPVPHGAQSRIRLDQATGFPVQSRLRRRVIAAVTALGVLLVLGLFLVPRPGSTPMAGQPRTGTPSAAPIATGPAQPPVVAPSATSTPPATRPPSNPDPTDPATPSPSATAFLVVVTSGGVMCSADGVSYVLNAKVLTTATMTSARIYWTSEQSGTQSTALTQLSRNSAQGGKSGLRFPAIEWWVRARAADGTIAESSRRTSLSPCV